jgi:hypothetical protein
MLKVVWMELIARNFFSPKWGATSLTGGRYNWKLQEMYSEAHRIDYDSNDID